MLHLLTMMMNRESSLHVREATAIRIDYTQLGIPNYTTYVEPNLAYVNSAFGSSKTRTVRRHLRVQYSSNLAIAMRVHATPAISPLLVCG
jgi:hypothetical protein